MIWLNTAVWLCSGCHHNTLPNTSSQRCKWRSFNHITSLSGSTVSICNCFVNLWNITKKKTSISHKTTVETRLVAQSCSGDAALVWICEKTTTHSFEYKRSPEISKSSRLKDIINYSINQSISSLVYLFSQLFIYWFIVLFIYLCTYLFKFGVSSISYPTIPQTPFLLFPIGKEWKLNFCWINWTHNLIVSIFNSLH